MTDRRHQPTEPVNLGTGYREPDLFGLAAGAHACHFHHDLGKVRRMAGELLSHWLSSGYPSCYVGSGRPAEVRRQLALTDGAASAGLTLISAEEFRTKGELDIGNLWRLLRRALVASEPRPLRLIIESLPVELETLFEGEERLNQLVTSQSDLSILCLCDQRALPPHALNRLLELHPEICIERRTRRNLFYDPRLSERGPETERAWFEQRLEETLRMASGQESVSTSERLQALIHASPVAIIALDRDARVSLWCPSAERMFGWSEKEVEGRLSPIVPDEKRGEARALLQRVFAGETLTGIELVRQRKDGSRIDVSLSAAPLRTRSGRATGVIALLEDISKRKKAEQAQRRLLAILEATPDVVGTTDSEGQILFVNRAGRELFGFESDPSQRISLTRIHPPPAARRILSEAIPQAIAGGSWSGESTVLDREGNEIPVLQVIIAHRDEAGEIDYLSTVIREITERKRAEDEKAFLAEASRTLADSLEPDEVLDRLADLVVPRLADFCLIWFESGGGDASRVARHRDRRKQLLADRACLPRVDVDGQLPVPELATSIDEKWLRAAAPDDDQREALRALGPRSAIVLPLQRQRLTRGQLLLARDGSERGYREENLSMLRDLGERAALAIENALLYRQARSAVSMRDEVLRVVAHDLRNPLATIALAAGVLLQSMPPGQRDGQRRHLDLIEQSVKRADRLIDDLLDVARIEAGHFSVDRKPEESRSLLEEAVKLHEPQAREKGIRLETNVSQSLPRILGDHDRLLQLFGNLLGNAIKFTPQGGTIEVGASPGNRQVEFWVSDNGPGIPLDDQPNLFEAFWQREVGRNGGAGLGLAIAKVIVEMHGGTIGVESAGDGGATFRFTVPTA
jgi:PAS domain S-box-containing protein